jgi:fluoride exporter
MLILGIAIAGMIGAPTRYVVDAYVVVRSRVGLPLATWFINVTGSFILGFLTGLALYHAFPSTPRAIIGTGFCGAYTTFSTFSYEVVRLAEDHDRSAAIRVLLLSVFVPALAAAFGMALATL